MEPDSAARLTRGHKAWRRRPLYGHLSTASGGKARRAVAEKHRLARSAAPLNRVLRSARSVLRGCWRIVPPNKPVWMAHQKIQISPRRSRDEPPYHHHGRRGGQKGSMHGAWTG